MTSRREFVGLLAATQAVQASVEKVSAELRQKKVSPVELTRQCLERIEELNGKLNAFVTVTADAALEQARAFEAEIQAGNYRGPWHGVPIALKDLYDTAGVRTTAGSRQWADRVPSRDAEVVRRLKAAGAIVLGKTNMDEFAYNFTGETSSFGTSRNPWDVRRSAGGSSGGSAVAVATGMCLAALGSDTGGSIRLPASFCGITGFKPTYGIVSAEGVAPLAWSLDHVGPMCRSASDAALMLDVLTGKPDRSPSAAINKLTLGIPRALFYEDLDSRVEKIVADATDVLSRMTLGARDVVLPRLRPSRDLPDLPESYTRIITAEAYAFHQDMIREHPDRYDPGTRKSIESGSAVTAAEYIRARRTMERLRAESAAFFTSADLLITPTALGPAFEFGERRLAFLRNTAPWNLLGLPAISVPCGFTPDGLPVGLQITGRAGQDYVVLALAKAYQRLTDWHLKRSSTPEIM